MSGRLASHMIGLFPPHPDPQIPCPYTALPQLPAWVTLCLADSVHSGYKSSPFPLKANQQSSVARILAESGFMPNELVNGEVDWFYNHLGIDNTYL